MDPSIAFAAASLENAGLLEKWVEKYAEWLKLKLTLECNAKAHETNELWDIFQNLTQAKLRLAEWELNHIAANLKAH